MHHVSKIPTKNRGLGLWQEIALQLASLFGEGDILQHEKQVETLYSICIAYIHMLINHPLDLERKTDAL